MPIRFSSGGGGPRCEQELPDRLGEVCGGRGVPGPGQHRPGPQPPATSPAFAPAGEWPAVKAIGYALRRTTHGDGRETRQVRYHIGSRYLSGRRFAEAVRGIEAMHWVLEVTFREDDSRTRERTLGSNLSWLRRFAVTLLKRQPVTDGLRGKLLRCGDSTEFLAEVLELQGS